MKKISILLALLLGSATAIAQQQKPFDYPLLITCKPTTHIQADIRIGVQPAEGTFKVKKHVFEYLGNGRYQFKFDEPTMAGYKPQSFESKLSYKETVLNLYIPNTPAGYSIKLYENYYVGSIGRDTSGITIMGAGGDLFFGACEIKWR